MQAKIVQNRQMQRSAIEDILNPINGYRGALAAKGKEVKNHMKEQRELIKKKTLENQQKALREQEPAKEMFKMKQFSNVPSKVRQEILHRGEADELRPVTARPNSARGAKPPVAFGRTYSATGFYRPESAGVRRGKQENLNKELLDKLPKQN
jgi:hypothetical protein